MPMPARKCGTIEADSLGLELPVVSFRSSPSDSIVQLGLSNFVNYIYV